jgi:NaMN:DMB phosphoribosyltransferase
MTETELKNRLKTITQPDEAARKAAHAHWASLAKPLGGLGDLEPLLEDVAALTGVPQFDFSKRAVLVLCADNGVIAQGISQSGSDVTRAVLQNLAQRKTSVCKMAETVHCGVIPVDMGIAGAPVDGVKNCRVRVHTNDFTGGPAMTLQHA